MTFLSFFAERILDDQVRYACRRRETHSELRGQLVHDAARAAAEPIYRPMIGHSGVKISALSELTDLVTRLSWDATGNSSNVAIE
jgi:hypothetical protein